MKPVTMTAAYVVSIPSTADAKRALRQSDYHPPDAEFVKLPLTDSIADADEEAEAEPEPEEEAEPESDERTSVVSGKSVTVRVCIGVRRLLKKKKRNNQTQK